MPPRVFILSPARLDGERARLLFEPVTLFPVAQALRSDEGAPLGEVFSFLSGLYFRGKLAYAETFARPPATLKPGVFVITTNRGLVPASNRITLEDLAAFAAFEIDKSSEPFRAPLKRDAKALAQALGLHGERVLLGSIATAKYVNVLVSVFGKRLLFPAEFVGRGDMSRGGLMLRCVEQGTELNYVPVQGAMRRGTRPPKLPPRRTPRHSPR
jgi:hypothetical protein